MTHVSQPRFRLCHLLSGPPGAGKTRWISAAIAHPTLQRTKDRPAVLLAEQGRISAAMLRREHPTVMVDELRLPCLCCQPLPLLISAMQQLADYSGCSEIFVEVPAIIAEAIGAEIDRSLRWPRRLIICLGHGWERAAENSRLSFFQSQLLSLADVTVHTSRAPRSSEEIAST